MKLKNKILLILSFFALCFIFSNSDCFAVNNYNLSSQNLETLSYDFCASIVEASDRSQFKANPDDYPYFLMLQYPDSIYFMVYSKNPLMAYSISNDYGVKSGFTSPSGNTFFYVYYSYKESRYIYYEPETSQGMYRSEYFTGYWASYPVYEGYNRQKLSDFFLARSEIIPFNTGLILVESQLIPVQVKGVLKILLPVFLVIFSTLLIVSLIRSKTLLAI